MFAKILLVTCLIASSEVDASFRRQLSSICGVDEYVSANTCVPCPAGTTNAAGDDASGSDTNCDITYCSIDQYVSSNACVACAAGTTNAAGDDASGSDTTCTDVPSSSSSSSDSSRLIVSFSIIGGVILLGVLLVFSIYATRYRRRRVQEDDNSTKKVEMKDLESQSSKCSLEPTKSNGSLPRTISKGLPTLASENTVQLGAFFKSAAIVKPEYEISIPKTESFQSAESGVTVSRSFDSSTLNATVHDNGLIL